MLELQGTTVMRTPVVGLFEESIACKLNVIELFVCTVASLLK